MNEMVPVSAVLGDSRKLSISQLEFLRKHGIRSAVSRPYGRGYRHFITAEDAERLRLTLSHARKKPRAKRKQPELKVAEQIHFDSIETKESFWARARNAFNVLVGR